MAEQFCELCGEALNEDGSCPICDDDDFEDDDDIDMDDEDEFEDDEDE